MRIVTVTHYNSLRVNPFAEARDKQNWIRASENYERICLNK